MDRCCLGPGMHFGCMLLSGRDLLWINAAKGERYPVCDIEHRIDKVDTVIIAEGINHYIPLTDTAGEEQLLSFCTIEDESAWGIEAITFAEHHVAVGGVGDQPVAGD